MACLHKTCCSRPSDIHDNQCANVYAQEGSVSCADTDADIFEIMCKQSAFRQQDELKRNRRRRRRNTGNCAVASTRRLSSLLVLVVAATTRTEATAGLAAWWAKAIPFKRVPLSDGKHSGSEADNLPFPGAEPPDEVVRRLEQEQLAEQAADMGFEVLAEEAGEKKRSEIFRGVARGCAVGTEMTLLMGGAALLFRLLPVFLGRDLEDEDDEGHAPYLLHGGSAKPQVLQAAEQQALLTEAGEEGAGKKSEGKGQLHGESAVIKAEGGKEEDVEAGEVVAFNRRRAAWRKARRISRPLLKAMAVPLFLLGVARLVLGDVLAESIDPMDELLFGDDITALYSERLPEPPREALPFALDSEFEPGRTKMKEKGVQRPPRPTGEEDEPKKTGLFDVSTEEDD